MDGFYGNKRTLLWIRTLIFAYFIRKGEKGSVGRFWKGIIR